MNRTTECFSIMLPQSDLTLRWTAQFGPPPNAHRHASRLHTGAFSLTPGAAAGGGHPIVAVVNTTSGQDEAAITRDHVNRVRLALNEWAVAGGAATGSVQAVALTDLSFGVASWGRRGTLAVRFTSTRTAIQAVRKKATALCKGASSHEFVHYLHFLLQIMDHLSRPGTPGLDPILVGHTWKDLNVGLGW